MKTILVIVRSEEPAKIAEALRGAVGLTLRRDRVRVILADAAAPHADPRAVATLTSFGHPVEIGDAHVADAIADADAIEVWS